MKIHRLYADKNGESHFEDVEVEFKESTPAGRLSARLPATGIIFRQALPDYALDWHLAPRRQRREPHFSYFVFEADSEPKIHDLFKPGPVDLRTLERWSDLTKAAK